MCVRAHLAWGAFRGPPHYIYTYICIYMKTYTYIHIYMHTLRQETMHGDNTVHATTAWGVWSVLCQNRLLRHLLLAQLRAWQAAWQAAWWDLPKWLTHIPTFLSIPDTYQALCSAGRWEAHPPIQVQATPTAASGSHLEQCCHDCTSASKQCWQ